MPEAGRQRTAVDASARRLLRRPGLGASVRLALGLAVAFLLAFPLLGLSPAGLIPGEGGLRVAREFFAAALHPSLSHEAAWVPAGTPPFLARVALALWRTVLFATAAMSLAVPAGLLLGFLASSAWWAEDPGLRRRPGPRRAAFLVQWATRLAIAALRSVHELLWAVVLLAAVGLNTAGAVLALALPFTGVLAKVYSEMIDEAPPDSAASLRGAGAGALQAFLWGRLPRALPDMAAYTFYRFECAVRSSAVLGFFGYETLGYYLSASFENLHYREVWTYLYGMIVVVLLLEAWSGGLRRRLVA